MDGRTAMRPYVFFQRASAFGERTLRKMRAATGGRPYKKPAEVRLCFLDNHNALHPRSGNQENLDGRTAGRPYDFY